MVTTIAGWTIAVIVGVVGCAIFLALVILSFPVALEVRGSAARPISVCVVWVFGAVRKEIIPSTSSNTKRHERQRERRGKDGKRRSGDSQGRSSRRRQAVGTILFDEDSRKTIIKGVCRWARHVIRRVTVAFDGVVYVGLTDPADTGIAFGLTGPLTSWAYRQTGVSIVPSFDVSGVRVDGSGAVSLVPIRLLPPTIQLVFSPTGWRVFKMLRGKT